MYYGWLDFEEDESSDSIPDKYILTIGTFNEHHEFVDEIAIIVHRTAGGQYPLDGELAESKRKDAQRIVDALNAEARG